MQQYLPLILALVAVVAFYMLLVTLFRKRTLKARTMRALHLPEDAPSYQENNNKSDFLRFYESALSAIGVSIQDTRKAMYSELGAAGIQTEEQATYFLFCRFFVQGLLVMLAMVVVFTLLLNTEIALTSLAGSLRLLAALVLLIVGVAGHKILLDKLASKRKLILTRSFPDALDLLLVCVEAGMPLDTALARVSREMKNTHPLLVRELERTRIELGVFGDRKQTLQNMADRVNIKSFRAFSSALIQTEKYGTNLADAMRALADDLRSERLLDAENKAARVPALITVPIIALVLFPLLLLIVTPPILRLFQMGGLPE